MAGNPFHTSSDAAPFDVDSEILRLHVDGHSPHEVAGILGVPPAVVLTAIERYLSDHAGIQRAARVMVESARLDALTLRYMPAARRGDVEAAGMVLAVSKDRRKLLGLDAPAAVTVDTTLTIAAVEDTVRTIMDTALPVVSDVDESDGDGFPVLDVSPAATTPPTED